MLGQCVGKAVTEIQTGGVAAFAEIMERLTRQMCLFEVHRFDPNTHAAKQSVALLNISIEN